MGNPVTTTSHDGILEVLLDRPKANAIDAATSRVLSGVFADFRDDPSLRVAILTGAGERFFSAGWDLNTAAEGEDWALVWTLEELQSERVISERSGWFGTVEREVFALDPFAGRGADTGATLTERSIILPQRPFQVLAERNPPGFAGVRKFVVGEGGRVLRY